MTRLFPAFLFALLPAVVVPGHAMTTAGAGNVVVIPVVVKSSSYESEIYVRNPTGSPLQLNVKFYEANTSSVPGQRSCSPLVIAAWQTAAMTLSSQCTLGAGNHHGILILENAATEKTATFAAYNRTQTPGGNGFSIEGFPIGNFSGDLADVVGLKRQAAAPVYQSNCFVAALGEPVNYTIDLRDAGNNPLGSQISGSLQPYQMVRYLDIFAAAGLPAGTDYSNVQAFFNDTDALEPAFVALCTVQESTFFGADVRIAKSRDANDLGKRKSVCYSQSPCGTVVTGSAATAIPDAATKYIHQTIITAPDYIKCELVSLQLANLEMQIRGPGDTYASGLFSLPPGYTAAPYTAGGSDQTSLYIFTGHRAEFNSGYSTRVFIDVSYREGSGTATFPIEYGITCYSGNGMAHPWVRATRPDDF